LNKTFLIACVAFAASCGVEIETAPVKSANAEAHPAQNTETHWTYDDQSQWGEACLQGTRQSPIDLREQTLIDEPDINFAYFGGAATIFNNGHAIEVTAPEHQTMTTGEEVFTLLQAHFHDPSEHHLDGETFPMEMHLVHRRPDCGRRRAVPGRC
jgi:carbonic anhydrase